MSFGSGISSQLGLGEEPTYGTFKAPDHFLPIDKEALQLKQTVVQGAPLGVGPFKLAQRRVITTLQGTGSIDMQLVNRGMGVWLKHLMGASSITRVGSSAAYSHHFDFADTFGESLTLQAGTPDLSGVVHPYSFLGCKITDATLVFATAKDVTAQFTVDAQKVDESQTLAVAAFDDSLREFVGTDVQFTIGDFGSLTPSVPTTGVTQVQVKIQRPLANTRFYLGNAYKREPIQNNFTAFSATVTADFTDKTEFADRFVSGEGFSLGLKATGLPVDETTNDQFSFVLPCCFLTGNTPQVGGPGIVSGSYPVEVLSDGTHTPFIETVSAEATL